MSGSVFPTGLVHVMYTVVVQQMHLDPLKCRRGKDPAQPFLTQTWSTALLFVTSASSPSERFGQCPMGVLVHIPGLELGLSKVSLGPHLDPGDMES